MAKYRYATVWQNYGYSGEVEQIGYWVFLSDETQIPTSLRHETRQYFKDEQEAIDFAHEWVQPKRGEIRIIRPPDEGSLKKKLTRIK